MRYLGRFLYALARGLDVVRRGLHLLLLLALLAIAIGAYEASRAPPVPQMAALVVRPSGQIVEQLSGAPLERAISQARGQGPPQTLLWDLTTAIRAAAGDRRIGALYIDTDDMSATGEVKLEELAAAIRDFRRSGKRIISFGHNFAQSQYLLASQADEVYLDPIGAVLLDGYARYPLYFHDLLKKYDVDVHLFRVGQFKSAEEIFTRDNMSMADRQQTQEYLSALWNGYARTASAVRGITPAALLSYANDYVQNVTAAGGDTAQVAKQARLVTGLATEPQVDARLMQLVGVDSSGRSFRQISVADYLRATHAGEQRRAHGPAVGVVIASGDILDGLQPPGSIGGESTAALLRQARLDRDIKAVVLRIDSPGGSVQASEQIYRAVLALQRDGKPVVVSMSDLAASGGYYIGAGADEIIASPNTLTGSIGVFAALPTFNRTLARFGVHVDGVGTTPLSGQTQLTQPLSKGAGQLLQSVVDHMYQEFLLRVAKGRGKPVSAIDTVAQGRVWAGVDALKIGLVDRLGTYEDAIQEAARRAKLTGAYGVRRIAPPLHWDEQLLLQLDNAGEALVKHFAVRSGGAQLATTVAQPLSRLQQTLAHWASLFTPNRVYAYCFCALQ